ncbi:hypothetical protein CEUSTIGMA_g11701.t1 [Chlamydomonas eustigma]|uniref:Aminoglycoside phosphotransferase domain-containing protein n=1 Tax=Chlamydomonas eustigma TaxID=1157962 RepID=A0A250XMW8_9CHLO|nr:hypothetical protein CEUSTIGMA_g11701.t1 [Chlamydomonas eustigma]|eukprot:GAX84279.1 hypothetical protein CEUSTIGMA_g11701.t1 [Chlamydomonas eustigma]
MHVKDVHFRRELSYSSMSWNQFVQTRPGVKLKHASKFRADLKRGVTSNIEAVSYIKASRVIQFKDPTLLKASELVEGQINYLFLVQTPSDNVVGDGRTSAVLKYCPPYVKSLGANVFPLRQDRLRIEAAAQAKVHALCPQYVPELFKYDPISHVIIQEYLPDHVKLTTAIHRFNACLPSGLGRDLGYLMSTYLFHTSQYYLGKDIAVSMAEDFKNEDIFLANEGIVFNEAFDPDCGSNSYSLELESIVNHLRLDERVQRQHARLLSKYRDSKEALIHHDLHFGNLLVGMTTSKGAQTQEVISLGRRDVMDHNDVSRVPLQQTRDVASADAKISHPGSFKAQMLQTSMLSNDDDDEGWRLSGSLKLIDFEFAMVGPMAYDVGSLLSNLLMAYCVKKHRRLQNDRSCLEMQGGDQYSLSNHSLTAGTHPRGSVAKELCPEGGNQAKQDAKEECQDHASEQPQFLIGDELLEEVLPEFLEELSSRLCTSVTTSTCYDDRADELIMMSTPVSNFKRDLLLDSWGFAAICMVRLTIGRLHYPPLDAIQPEAWRVSCSAQILELAHNILVKVNGCARMHEGGKCEEISSDFVQLVRETNGVTGAC